jgi:tRNA threonylcarbamoyladenosine biosynthesis protein TsaE
MKKHTLVYSLDDLILVARTLHAQLGSAKIIALSGPLGAGKTTVVQAILRYAGVSAVVQSPTFTYLTSYDAPSGWKFYHFDLYRLQSTQEFIDAGFHEYLYEPMSYALVEWPEVITPLLTHDVCFVDIDYVNEQTRRLWYYLQ